MAIVRFGQEKEKIDIDTASANVNVIAVCGHLVDEDGYPGAQLQSRVKVALDVWHDIMEVNKGKGKGKQSENVFLLFTGGIGHSKTMSEAQAAADYALELAKNDDILPLSLSSMVLESNSTTTFGNALFGAKSVADRMQLEWNCPYTKSPKPMPRGLERIALALRESYPDDARCRVQSSVSIVVVTSSYHLYRAMWLFQRHFSTVHGVGVPFEEHEESVYWLYWAMREILAILWNKMLIWLYPLPQNMLEIVMKGFYLLV